MAAIRERSPTAHFSQQLEKWAKEPEGTKGSFTSLRAMPGTNLILPATRSRKFSCIVPSKDCLSNSAAAADANAEQRFWFYRCRKRTEMTYNKAVKIFRRGCSTLRRDLLVFASGGPISFNSERNGGKNAGKNCVFAFPQRAMGCGNLMLPATRSRKYSCIVPSKDCLSNSAAAADANAEQCFWFYCCTA